MIRKVKVVYKYKNKGNNLLGCDARSTVLHGVRKQRIVDLMYVTTRAPNHKSINTVC